MNSIISLNQIIERLRPDQIESIQRIFEITTIKAGINIDGEFPQQIIQDFANNLHLDNEQARELIQNQLITRVYNKIEKKGALFNSLRAARPGAKTQNSISRIYQIIKESEKNCDFCKPISRTPQDIFGRIKGKHCITSANIARYDRFSSLIIFEKHNPLDFIEEEIADYLETAQKWFIRVLEHDHSYCYPFLFWNCLDSAAASKTHGHMQVLMANQRPYAQVADLIEAMKAFDGEYLDELAHVYNILGLRTDFRDLNILYSLNPVKEMEMMIYHRDGSKDFPEGFSEVITKILRTFVHKLHTYSFNISLLTDRLPDNQFPYILRIVGRGDPLQNRCDIGGMELWAEPVISADPYKIKEHIDGGLQDE